MGRPIGSLNRQKPFRDALNVALHSRPLALRRIADKLLDRAEQGDLAAAREVIDRLDGRPVQAIDRHEVLLAELCDAELIWIASGGRIEDERKVIPPPSKD